MQPITIQFAQRGRNDYRAKRTYVIMLIAILIWRWQQTGSNSFLQDSYAFTELKKPPFAVSIYVMTVATNDLEFVYIATS